MYKKRAEPFIANCLNSFFSFFENLVAHLQIPRCITVVSRSITLRTHYSTLKWTLSHSVQKYIMHLILQKWTLSNQLLAEHVWHRYF